MLGRSSVQKLKSRSELSNTACCWYARKIIRKETRRRVVVITLDLALARSVGCFDGRLDKWRRVEMSGRLK